MKLSNKLIKAVLIGGVSIQFSSCGTDDSDQSKKKSEKTVDLLKQIKESGILKAAKSDDDGGDDDDRTRTKE